MSKPENALRAESLKQAFSLIPHPEGGFFAETYTAPFEVNGRSLAGSIYFLLEGDQISHLHRIDCDEVWYYHEGCGLKITVLRDGQKSTLLLGPDPERGQAPMAVIPAGCAFASENTDKTGYTLVSCMTAPHFTYDAFHLLSMDEVRSIMPDTADELGYLIL